MAYHSFENLEVWKKACRIAVRIYEIMKDIKDYGLRDQMTQAAVSMASNIAEVNFSFDLNPPPLVEDPERFYRSGAK